MKKPPREKFEPPRPLCMCGEPGTFQVQIEIEELVLDRDAGISAHPYWRPKFHTGTKIASIMCKACIRANVQLQVAASAKIEKGKEAP